VTMTKQDAIPQPSQPQPIPASGTLTGSQIIWDTLTRLGVTVVFGYPGGAIMPAYDALPQYPIRHVLTRHEQGAAHMADGYARASGQVGVAVATSGPGATNLTTGIANAMLDSSPIVCITGQVASPLLGTDAFQEVDITGVTLPITKHNFLVTRPEEIVPALRQAFHIARSGRPGPVVVDITKDAQFGRCAPQWSELPIRLPGYRPDRQPLSEELQRALDLIHGSERPIILAGQGIVQSGATSLLLQWVERCPMPVALTLLGLGAFPASDPLNLGMMGMHGEAWVNNAIQEADLILALGMRFDDRVTGNLQTYAVNAKKIHVELDPAEVNKNVKVDVPLIGDVRAILSALLSRLEPRDRSAWLAYVDQLRTDSGVVDVQQLPDTGQLLAPHVIHDLWRMTQGKALVVTDVGQHQMWEAQYYKHERPRKLITSGGLGTMGFGLPAAIGARFACPDDEIWAIAGDGGFQMTQAELATIAQERIKLNIAIINNGYLGMVRQWQQFFFGGRYVATPIGSPDFVKIAEAHGLRGLRVTRRADVAEAVTQARSNPDTTLIDFRVEGMDSVYPMVPSGADLKDMIRRPQQPSPSAGPGPEKDEKP
jgi:acetolactate synthase-1/2/3 large subunit